MCLNYFLCPQRCVLSRHTVKSQRLAFLKRDERGYVPNLSFWFIVYMNFARFALPSICINDYGAIWGILCQNLSSGILTELIRMRLAFCLFVLIHLTVARTFKVLNMFLDKSFSIRLLRLDLKTKSRNWNFVYWVISYWIMSQRVSRLVQV
jgi:hypothetical protein